MAKRKKRNAITLVSLLLALVALIGVYIWYTNRDADSEKIEEVKEVTKPISLATLDIEQLSSLHYIGQDADMTLILEDGVWKSKEDPERPINQTNVTNMISIIDEISATRLVSEAPENLGDYGLVEPTAYLQATQVDGGTVTLQIGAEVGSGDGYYALVNEDNKVYLLEAIYGKDLNYTNLDMTAMEETPTITAEKIHYIKILKRDGEDFELKYDPDNEIDISGRDMFSWVILQPYAEGYTADGTRVSEIQPNYTNIKFISCVDYSGKDLSLYGLEDPMASVEVGYYETYTETLEKPEVNPDTGEEVTEKTYYDEKEYKIYIGNLDESGNYYVKKEGTNAVYTMEAKTVDTMLQVDAFSMVNPYVCIPNIDNVDQIIVEIEGKTYTMEIERTTKKNDAGEDETITTYLYNGNKVEEEIFKDVYQILITAKYDASIKEEVVTKGVDPFMTTSFHIIGDNESIVTASYLPYDDSFYAIETNDGTRFLADKRKIDTIAAAIVEFVGFDD